MRILLLFSSLCIGCVSISAQNPIGFDEECQKYISGTVTLANSAQLHKIAKNPSIYILDAREKREYEVCHIPKAKFIGFDNFNKKTVSSIPKSDSVFIYCSIGYRSEKIGEKLQQMGYVNVFNLYGGIFNWVNSGYTVVDKNNKQTEFVHGYNKEWSKLLNEKRCSIVVGN